MKVNNEPAETKLKRLLKDNHGYLFLDDSIKETGLSKPTIYSFIHGSGLAKAAPGIYCSAEVVPDDCFIFQKRHPEAVFSHGTALYLLGLSSRDPLKKDITVTRGGNPSTFGDVNVHYVVVDKLAIDTIEVPSPGGHRIRCYNTERTLIDLLRNRSTVDPESLSSALKEYVSSSKRQLPKLIEVAKSFRVDKLLETYLEVLV